MEKAITALNAIEALSDRVIDYLYTHLRHQTYLKREFLLRAGRSCDYLWFIDSGVAGCFYEKSDKTHTGWILQEGDIVTSIPAFFKRIPSEENIKALDDIVAYALHHDEMEFMYNKFPEFNRHGRLLLTKYYVMTEERIRAFHNQPPVEKFRYLMEKFPELVLKVKNADLAGFLGVTQETLSRVKGRSVTK